VIFYSADICPATNKGCDFLIFYLTPISYYVEAKLSKDHKGNSRKNIFSPAPRLIIK